jgi:hypothetical protein
VLLTGMVGLVDLGADIGGLVYSPDAGRTGSIGAVVLPKWAVPLLM